MDEIETRLEQLRSAGLHRSLRSVEGPQGPRVSVNSAEVLMLCSNNYLGLADHPRVRKAAADAAERFGTGSGASPLVCGHLGLHRRLEQRLASFVGYEAALLFGSGYLANTGIIPALAEEDEVVFSDELNHASIVDGCRLSRAETFVYRHRDLEHLAWGLERAGSRAALIVSDGVFSMDGDVAPVPGLVDLAERHDCRLMIDDAHAIGAVGPAGRGTVAAAGAEDVVDVVVGTLGKAFGSYGAFACTSAEVRELLINTARPFIFSTAPPPPALGAALAALALLESCPGLVTQLARNADVLREALRSEGLAVHSSPTQIVPLIVGDAQRTVDLCQRVLDAGVFAQAIRPPTVPEGTSRLRLSVMANHRADELRAAAHAIGQAAQAIGMRTAAEPLPLRRAA